MANDNNTASPTGGRRVNIGEIRDWVDVIFKTILALAGVYVGYYFSHQKQ